MDEVLNRYWATLQDRAEIDSAVQLQDYLDVDNEVLIGGTLTLDEIAQASSSNADETAVESDEEIAATVEQEPVKGAEARQAFHQLRRYFRENDLNPNAEIVFDQIESSLLNDQMAKLTQPKISSFFAPQ